MKKLILMVMVTLLMVGCSSSSTGVELTPEQIMEQRVDLLYSNKTEEGLIRYLDELDRTMAINIAEGVRESTLQLIRDDMEVARRALLRYTNDIKYENQRTEGK